MMFQNVPAESYRRFMGRFSEPLADRFLAWVGVVPGERALDVGCGPGAMTACLVERLGPAAVTAVDPSPSFVAAASSRFPGAEIRVGAAEELEFADGAFDLTIAQLVVHFMSDPVAGVQQMARVTRPGGRLAACVWDHAGGRGPLSIFLRAVREVDQTAEDATLARESRLAPLFAAVGLEDVREEALTVRLRFQTFEEWWEPFTLGVGRAGSYVARHEKSQRQALRNAFRRMTPEAPFDLDATAWCVAAVKGGGT